VVVVMGQGLGDALSSTTDVGLMVIILVGVSAALTVVILVLLLGIKYLILMPDRK
jgi:hypothetical protein